jgi:hypothetical protein
MENCSKKEYEFPVLFCKVQTAIAMTKQRPILQNEHFNVAQLFRAIALNDPDLIANLHCIFEVL